MTSKPSRTLGWGAALAAGLLMSACHTPDGSNQAAPEARRPAVQPNIVLIMAEDITTLLAAYGDPNVRTPNIDALAREGTRYTHAYQAAGVCAPARAAMITGMYPTSIGAQHMRTLPGELANAEGGSKKGKFPNYSVVLPPEVKPFPELLRRAGYYATNNHKTDYQFEAPVTTWDESGPAASYRYRPPGAPFFASYTLFVTHESMLALRKEPLSMDPARLKVPPIFPDTPVVRADLARQYNNIEIMDRHLGELIRQLKADGVYDNSYIFFVADNGGTLPWYKREILERGTHVPLIVKLPKSTEPGRVRDELVSGVDLAPTMLSIAGVPIPSHMQGQAFLGPQRAGEPRRYVYAARDRMDSEYDRSRMVRSARYRYIYNYHTEKPFYQPLQFRLMLPMMREILQMKEAHTLPPVTAAWFASKPVEELYDVERDPYELKNLVADPGSSAPLAELREAFQNWTRTTTDLGGVPEREMLRKMWNGGDHPPATAVPVVIESANGVQIRNQTLGASIGYWIEGPIGSSTTSTHTVHSWDYEVLLGEFFKGRYATPGEQRLASRSWTVYGGETIPLRPGEKLHVNAQRIGYTPAEIVHEHH